MFYLFDTHGSCIAISEDKDRLESMAGEDAIIVAHAEWLNPSDITLVDGEIQVRKMTIHLETAKTVKLKDLAQQTAAVITGGFWSASTGQPHRYDSDEKDQQNLMLMLQAALSADFAEHPIYQGRIPIRAVPEGEAAKAVLPHTAVQMQSLVNDMALHIGECKTILWQLQLAVTTAETLEELERIQWPS